MNRSTIPTGERSNQKLAQNAIFHLSFEISNITNVSIKEFLGSWLGRGVHKTTSTVGGLPRAKRESQNTPRAPKWTKIPESGSFQTRTRIREVVTPTRTIFAKG